MDNLVCAEGEWSGIPGNYAFRVGDVIRVKHAFIPSQEGVEIRLKTGYYGFVCFIDVEGEAHVWFPELLFAGLRGKHVGLWIDAGSFRNVELKGAIKEVPD